MISYIMSESLFSFYEENKDILRPVGVNLSEKTVKSAKTSAKNIVDDAQGTEGAEENKKEAKEANEVKSNIKKVSSAITAKDINEKLKTSPTMVKFEDYKKYINAIFDYIKDNMFDYAEAIDRVVKEKWDILAIQKTFGRTDNQIKNDMVREVFISKVACDAIDKVDGDDITSAHLNIEECYKELLSSLKTRGPSKSMSRRDSTDDSNVNTKIDEKFDELETKINTSLEELYKKIEDKLDKLHNVRGDVTGLLDGGGGSITSKVKDFITILRYDSDDSKEKINDTLLFFIPCRLSETLNADDNKQILNADYSNKVNVHKMWWPSAVLKLIVWCLKSIMKLNAANKNDNDMYYRCLDFNYRRFSTMLNRTQAKDCPRVDDLLRGKDNKKGIFNVDFNVLGQDNIDDKPEKEMEARLNNRCDEKFKWDFLSRGRCKSLVKTRMKFDNKCNMKQQGSMKYRGGIRQKKLKSRRLKAKRKRTKRMKGGDDADGPLAVIFLIILLISIILMIAGSAAHNPGVFTAGLIIFCLLLGPRLLFAFLMMGN